MNTAPSLTAITWNLEWKRPQSLAGGALRPRIEALEPDIACLTESYDDFPTGGHVVTARPDYGYPLKDGRRKVLLWSRQPWHEVDDVGHPSLPPGRFVKARTETALGCVTVFGVCVPWAHAHVATGRRDRRPWEDHVAYLKHLAVVLADVGRPVIVLGDINQRIPRRAGHREAAKALERAISGLRIATSGAIRFPKDEREPSFAIDHVIHDDALSPETVEGVSNVMNGRRLSDHFGVCVRFGVAKARPADQ